MCQKNQLVGWEGEGRERGGEGRGQILPVIVLGSVSKASTVFGLQAWSGEFPVICVLSLLGHGVS